MSFRSFARPFLLSGALALAAALNAQPAAAACTSSIPADALIK